MTSFPSTDGTILNEMIWGPAPTDPAAPTGAAGGASRGTVILVHGYGEHIARYDAFARKLVAAGYKVHGCDLRGHGLSEGRRGHVARFDEYLGDLDALIARAVPGASRVFIIGHSMGGLVTSLYLIRRGAAGLPLGGATLGGVVLASPYYKLKLAVPALKLAAGRFFSKYWPALSLPSGLKGADVSRDPEIQRIYDNDPLNNKNATARWFTEATAAQDEVFERAAAIPSHVPYLMILGGADRIADPARGEEVFRRLAASDKKLNVYAGQFHELFNEIEPDRSSTISDVVEWLGAHP